MKGFLGGRELQGGRLGMNASVYWTRTLVGTLMVVAMLIGTGCGDTRQFRTHTYSIIDAPCECPEPVPNPCPEGELPVCHKPGTPAQQDKCLPPPAAEAHVRHGDFPGTCEDLVNVIECECPSPSSRAFDFGWRRGRVQTP